MLKCLNATQITAMAIAAAIGHALDRKMNQIKRNASENIVGLDVLRAPGAVLTNKYVVGRPGERHYGRYKQIAIDRARKLFGAGHVNVQPHSDAQASRAVFLALLQPGDRIMGLNHAHGGHLTHGSPVTMSGKRFDVVS